ncbi:non-specific lipid transfer protein GPI-anchored 5-like [Carya illinoinensis]|uniref:non-specific lipid transfer protein GPI-anchored 5-like n=1 Tax=Carya illinoinensis TaxID=32201 RepID=UPI001C71868F|nr:non-specific lipid transfer protein GPI-anchored 5-like [Carya illinoinensis]
MASKGLEMGLVLFLIVNVAMPWSGAMAQSSCSNVLTNLAPCLNYITGNSSTPSSSCCSQLSIVVQSSPQCLCSVLNGGASAMGININRTLALSLPGACNVKTPPISRCQGATSGPTTSGTPPVSSRGSSTVPSGSSNQTPEGATPPASDIPSGSGSGPSGSERIPSLDGGISDGSSIKAPLHLMLFLLFIVSCVSNNIITF